MTIYSTRDILDAALEAEEDKSTACLPDLPDEVELTSLIGAAHA